MLKTPIPKTPTTETDSDRYFAYLASHVKRSSEKQRIATIDPSQSARTTWTTPQVTILGILTTLTLVALWSFGISVLTLLFALVTILYVAMLCLSVAWMMAVARRIPQAPFDPLIIEELRNAPWPRYTILCPLYKEQAVVRQFVQAMQHMDYPTDCLQVLFLTEEDDQQTRNALLALNLPAHFEVVTVPQGTPKTKPRACNWGLQIATGEYVVIFDAEDIPDPQQLKKAILTFASTDVNVACVQAKLNFYNPTQNLLTRWFTIEYSLWFDLILPGLQALGFSLPLGGTSNHFRVSALKALGGWDAYNVTEDCDLGLKLAKYQFRTIMLESTTYEEANSRTMSWIRQRSRWIKGYMQTYLVHTRHPLKAIRQGKIKDLLSLHLFVGAGSMVLLINPIMWAMFALYLTYRPVDLYHQLFPWPVLYAGMLCFLVGNFLPIYVSMIACVKREQYALVKWCLLLPLYWVLASIASFLAGYELIVKPHHWHKTQHGLHLKDKKSTAKVKAIQMAGKATLAVKSVQPMGTVTQSVRAMSTLPVPAITQKRRGKKIKSRDPWLLATILLACVCSIAATTYYYIHHATVLYVDAQAHIRLARSIFDSRTPGFAQLGQVWLPLHHLFIVPFVWNDFLWRTGLAGAIPAMIAYIMGAYYTYGTMKYLTSNPTISFIVVIGYITNPNLLFLQSTPLSDTFCVCFFAISSYYFVLWVQREKIIYFVLMSISIWCITLVRYDGWALSVSATALIGLVCILRRYKLQRTLGMLVIYAIVAFTGIALWMTWCKIIDGSFLFFQSGPYSSQSMQMELLSHNILPTYHQILIDIKTYVADAYDNTGIIYFIIAPISLILLCFTWKSRFDYVAILVAFVPFAFYILTLYSGQSVIYVPGYTPAHVPAYTLFNSRYGIQALVPMLILSACLFTKISLYLKRTFLRYLLLVVCILVVLGQSFAMNMRDPITAQEGWQQCYFANRMIEQENIYFEQHYDGGGILTDIHASAIDPRNFDTNLSQLIDESNGSIWKAALLHPDRYVHWIAYTPQDITHDGVANAMHFENNTFLKYYHLVLVSTTGIHIYLLNTVHSIPNRTLSQDWTNAKQWCKYQGANK